MFVWARDEYMWVMKSNFAVRIELEMNADVRVVACLVFFQTFHKIDPGLSDVKDLREQLSRYATSC